MMYNDVMASV